jgi:membrane peptidoglycan carboxypeptidase
VHGSHVCAAPRRWRRASRGARGIGWWQPPPPGERTPRHRRPDGAPATAPGTAPGSPGRRLRRPLALGATLLVLGPLSALAPGFLLIGLPGPDDVVRRGAAVISYADGSELLRLAPPHRVAVALDRVPGPVRDAVLAARDPEFGSRAGADPAGLVRAVTGGDGEAGGAPAPVPAQFVDGALAGSAPTPWRAYREVVLVSKLALGRDRDQVLADYLNAVYLGRGDYGLAQGARDYFGKDVADLTTAEGALLAALIGAPTTDPVADPARAERLWGAVLDAMVARGWLTPADRAAARFPAALPRRPGTGLPADDRAPVVAAVLAELDGLGFGESRLALGGLRVTTTLDPDRQDRAAAAADRAGAGVGIVAVDPATGGVLAYRGGPDGLGPDTARAAQRVGAAVTPFVLLAGRLQDPPVGPDDCPGCPGEGLVAGLTQRIGPDAVAATAAAAGLAGAHPPATGEPRGPVDPAATEVDAVELASAYATLAAGGVRRPAHLVDTVGTADGRVLYRAPGGGERRLPEAAARAVVPAGPGAGAWAAGVSGGVAVAVRGAPASIPTARAARAPAAAGPAVAEAAAQQAWAELTGAG